jgi:hypothetical protein
MKKLLCVALLLLALTGAAMASKSCPANEIPQTLLYTKCEVQKPVDALTGEEITVVCIEQKKENNVWVDYPLKGLQVAIRGYNEEGELFQNMTKNLNGAGSAVFTPQVAGEYVVEAMVPHQESNSAQAVNVPWVATFNVAENPIKNRGIVKPTTPTGGAVAVEEPGPQEEPLIVEPAVDYSDRGLFDFVLNGSSREQDREDASNFVLMIVGLLIS